MFCVYFVYALCSSRAVSAPTGDISLYLCDNSINGDVCNTRGVAVYVSAGNPAPRPQVFYPISHTQWTFLENFISGTLGVTSSDQANVSGKFSGVFIPTYSGRYKFELWVVHKIVSKVCRFRIDTFPAIIELDMSIASGGTSYGLDCAAKYNAVGCSDYFNYAEWYYCSRQYDLVAYEKYPFFAGTRYNWGVPYNNNLWLKLYYTDPKSGIYWIRESDSYVGLDGYYTTPTASPSRSPTSVPTKTVAITFEGSSGAVPTRTLTPTNSITTTATATVNGTGNSSASSNGTSVDGDSSSLTRVNSKLTNASIIGGACAGALLIIIADIIIFVVVRRRRRNAELMSREGSSRRSSGSSRRKSSGGASRLKVSGSSSRRKSSGGASRRKVSGSSSRRKSSGGASRRKVSGSSSRRKSSGGASRRKVSGSSSRRKSSGGASRRKSGSSSRRKSSGGASRRKVSGGASHRKSSGGASRRKSSGGASHRKSGSGFTHRRSVGGSSHNKNNGGVVRQGNAIFTQ